eukprot:scaffold81449_cov39-Phaeocystis_antarctica.AAC.1
MQRRRGGALALLRTSTIRPKTRGRAARRLSRARPVQDRAGGEGGPQVVRGEVARLGEGDARAWKTEVRPTLGA